MAKPTVNAGTVTRTVADNVKMLRAKYRMSVREVSRLTASNVGGKTLTPNAVSEIENGQRKVDVDDLLALSVAMDVSPVALLMPANGSEEEWRYLTAEASIPSRTEIQDFVAVESWRRRFVPEFARNTAV